MSLLRILSERLVNSRAVALGARIFRFSRMSEINVLNKVDQSQQVATPSSNVAQAVQRMILRLKGKYLSDDGTAVDYVGLKADSLFTEFENLVKQFNFIDLRELNSAQRKAFFINVYNTLTIHGLAKCDPLPKSVTDISNFWKTTAYVINGHVFTLDDIEHGILRSNKRHPSSLIAPFSDSDPRLEFTMEELDPRIHFAINCGARSCPAIRVYSEENLDLALDGAASSSINGNLEIAGNEVKLSKLLLWYGSDFGTSSKEILRWLSRYLNQNHREILEKLISSQEFKLTYFDYDWLVNAP